jgi:opacity protein-like surface antigen
MKLTLTAAAAAAAAVALTALPAAAQTASEPSFYGNLGYTFVDGDGANLGAITGRLGARVHRYFGAEAELGLGIDSDTTDALGVRAKTKLQHSVAGYAVGYLPVAPNADLFVRGGYGSTKIKVSTPVASASDSEESWNYGAGGQYFFDVNNGVRAEYTRYDFRHGAGEADTWAVSYVRKF